MLVILENCRSAPAFIFVRTAGVRVVTAHELLHRDTEVVGSASSGLFSFVSAILCDAAPQ